MCVYVYYCSVLWTDGELYLFALLLYVSYPRAPMSVTARLDDTNSNLGYHWASRPSAFFNSEVRVRLVEATSDNPGVNIAAASEYGC
jgi:hypothetical protein